MCDCTLRQIHSKTTAIPSSHSIDFSSSLQFVQLEKKGGKSYENSYLEMNFETRRSLEWA